MKAKEVGTKKKESGMTPPPGQLITKGKLRDVNAAQAWFTLQDGSRFELAKGVSLAERKPGEEVSVSYEMKAGKKIATRVAKAA